MVVKHHQRFQLADRSFANIVKRDITRLAESHGFSQAEVGRINIVVSEMASNLLKYSPIGGEIFVRFTPDKALEIICLDNGPGMKDPQRMLVDGTSTTGTAGEGLGAIMRQSHTFDLYSHPGCGTVILSRIYKGLHEAPKKKSTFEIATVIVPKLRSALASSAGEGIDLLFSRQPCASFPPPCSRNSPSGFSRPLIRGAWASFCGTSA